MTTPYPTLTLDIVLTLREQEEFNELTDKSKEFILDNLKDFSTRAIRKFMKGQKEHGGFIADRPMLDEIENEVIDQFWYLKAAKERSKKGEREV